MWKGDSVFSVPGQVAEPGPLLWGRERLPMPVPHGCHADPQAVFADVVFDFTRLELQLRHFATQGCHDSQPHVPRVAHTLGEGEGRAAPPPRPPRAHRHQKSIQNPWGGGEPGMWGWEALRDRLTSTFCDGDTEVWGASIQVLTTLPPAHVLPPPHAPHPF